MTLLASVDLSTLGAGVVDDRLDDDEEFATVVESSGAGVLETSVAEEEMVGFGASTGAVALASVAACAGTEAATGVAGVDGSTSVDLLTGSTSGFGKLLE